MSIFLLIVLVFTGFINAVFSAPRPQSILIDSLDTKEYQLNKGVSITNSGESSSSDDYLSNDPIKSYMRSKVDSDEDNLYEGYVFDESICKVIDDRILCGYNLNKDMRDGDKTVDLGNGCFLRNDRVECGYVQQSYDKQKLARLRLKSIIPESSLQNATPTSDTIASEQTDKIEMAETPIPVSLSVAPDTTTIEKTTTNKVILQEHSPKTNQFEILSEVTISTKLLRSDMPHNFSVSPTVNESETEKLASTTFINRRDNSVTDTPVTNLSSHTELENDVDLKIENNIISTEGIANFGNRKRRYTDKISSKLLKSLLLDSNALLNSPMPSTFNRKAKKRQEGFRKNSDKDTAKTTCVENQDRIVCYDYKFI